MKTKKIYKRLVGVDRPARARKRDPGTAPFFAGAEHPFKKSAASHTHKPDAGAVPTQK